MHLLEKKGNLPSFSISVGNRKSLTKSMDTELNNVLKFQD